MKNRVGFLIRSLLEIAVLEEIAEADLLTEMLEQSMTVDVIEGCDHRGTPSVEVTQVCNKLSKHYFVDEFIELHNTHIVQKQTCSTHILMQLIYHANNYYRIDFWGKLQFGD